MKPFAWITNRLAARIAVVVLTVIVVLSIGYIWLQINNAKTSAMKVITSYGMHIGESYSKTIDTERLEAFLKNPQENEQYWSIRKELDQFRTQMGALYVYIFRIDDNRRSFIMIDGQPPGSEYASPINEETEVTESQTELLLKGETASSQLTVDPQYGTYISSYAPIKRADGTVIGVLGIDMDASVLDSIVDSILRESIPFYVSIAILTLLGIGIVMWVLIRAIGPLKWIVFGAEKIASGDFEQANRHLLAHPVRSRDEIGTMHQVIVNMSGSLKAMISRIVENIAHTSDQLVDSSELLTKKSNELLQTNTRVHEAASQVAEGASAQRISTEECARSMEEIATTIQRISEASLLVSDASSKALESAESGNQMVEQMNDQIRAIAATTEETVSRVHVLSEYSQEIEDTLQKISEIANQTKLLAFNATIEAARAGEHGAGFAVVAGEVRKLADDVFDSAHRISSLLQNVQNETQQIREAMNGNSRDVKMGEMLSEKVQESFAGVVEMFRLVSEQIHDISAATEQATAGFEEVAASVAEVAQIAKDSSDKMLHIQEQTNQQLHIVQRVADSATVLSDATHQLQESVKNIRI